MRSLEAARVLLAYVVSLAILGGGFYALVLYPFELDQLVKGAILGFMGSATTWVFGSATASATARQSERATQAGVGMTAANGQPHA